MKGFTLSGIDEAGLGPILGPFTAGCSRFTCREKSSLSDFNSAFDDSPLRDSKKVYTSGKSLAPLETAVLVHSLMEKGSLPTNAQEFIQRHIHQNELIHEILAIPYYCRLQDLALPLKSSEDNILKTRDSLLEAYADSGIEYGQTRITAVPAKLFNASLDREKNKSKAAFSLLAPLLKEAQGVSDRIIVDKQGGRNQYGELLTGLFQRRLLLAMKESATESVYRVEESRLVFQMKAEEAYPEVGLASLFAKYTREIMMASFNAYWLEKNSSLKPTAGYYTDGLRFLRDLETAGLLPEDKSLLVRTK